jgi:hypothetical protein
MTFPIDILNRAPIRKDLATPAPQDVGNAGDDWKGENLIPVKNAPRHPNGYRTSMRHDI